MDIEEAKKNLKGIDIRNFLSGMSEQSNYILDRAEETNEAIETVLSELEKKDKIIDLMAEWIEKYTKYYDEDGCYCEVEKDICNKNIECEYCIKQYFERKVENGN